MINPINPLPKSSGLSAPEQNKTKTKELKNNEEVKTTQDPAVKLEIGNEPLKASYSSKGTVKPDVKTIEALMQKTNEALAPLRQMVEALLTQQGLTFNKTALMPTEGEMVKITPEIRAEAQQQISEDGAFGVNNTSSRLVDFAIAISGGDKSKYDQLKSSIEEGYAKAKEAFGGKLPEISEQTLKMTLEKLEAWKNEA